MRKTPLKRIGRVGEANREARQRIAKIAEEKGLNYCELKFEGCQNWPLAPAHCRPRSFYQGNVELLSDYSQWISACQHCHTILDSRSQTSQEESDAIFEKLRPNY
jgi:hypothetical protein